LTGASRFDPKKVEEIVSTAVTPKMSVGDLLSELRRTVIE
jgi:hypothetical protein